MKTIRVDNSIISANDEAIKKAGISMVCDKYMNIEISYEDYKKLCEIIDEGDIHPALYTYIYDKHRGFLAYVDNMPGVDPLEEYDGVGFYPIEQYNGCETLLTYEDSYGVYEGEFEIDINTCRNIENDQDKVTWWISNLYIELEEEEDAQEEDEEE